MPQPAVVPGASAAATVAPAVGESSEEEWNEPHVAVPPPPSGSSSSPTRQRTGGSSNVVVGAVAIEAAETDDTPGVAPPEAADAAFCTIPLTTGSVAALGAMLALAMFAPIALSDRATVDFLALLCLLPAVAYFGYVGVFRRDDVHFRQVFARFAMGWMLLMPLSWIGACVIIVMCVIMVLVLSAILPLPGIVFGLLFYACVVFAITGLETTFQWAVVTRQDNVASMAANPRRYPFYGAAVALGMSSASCYYLILFLRSIADAANRSRCQEGWGEGGDHVQQHNATASHDGSRAPPTATHRQSSSCGDETMTSGEFIGLIVACVAFIQPMMCLASYHLGLIAARVQTLQHPIDPKKHIGPLILVRAVFLFFVVVGSFLLGPLNLLLLLVIFVGYTASVKYYERSMPRSYLDRVGHLNLFGYGSLPQDDPDAPPTTSAAATSAAAAANQREMHDV